MKIIKYVSFFVLLVVILVLLVAAFLPSQFSVVREVEINKPKIVVFNYVKYLKNQENFSTWSKIDLNMKHEFKGYDGIIGFVSAWESENPDVGKGEQEITGMNEGNRIDYQLRFIKPYESTSTAYMAFTEINPNKTKLQWGFEGEMAYPTNLMLLFVDMEGQLGGDLQTGLNNLKVILEKQ